MKDLGTDLEPHRGHPRRPEGVDKFDESGQRGSKMPASGGWDRLAPVSFGLFVGGLILLLVLLYGGALIV